MPKAPKFELQFALMARAAQDVIDNPELSPAEALWQRMRERRLDPGAWYVPDPLFPVMAIKVGAAVYGEHPDDHYKASSFDLENMLKTAA